MKVSVLMKDGSEVEYSGVSTRWRGVLNRRLQLVSRDELATGPGSPEQVVAEFPADSVQGYEMSDHYE